MLPFVSKMIPEPRPSGVSIWTNDGDTLWKTLTKLFCSAAAAGSAACDLEVARPDAKPTSTATHAETTRMTRASLSRFMPVVLPGRRPGNLRTLYKAPPVGADHQDEAALPTRPSAPLT